MNYQPLAFLIHKSFHSWSIVEFRQWLQFVHLQRLIPIFQKQQITPDVLKSASFKYLTQIGIKSNIIQKKILNWVAKGFSEFDEYLLNIQEDKQNCSHSINRQLTNRDAINRVQRQICQTQFQIAEQQPRLKITNFEGPQTVFYIAQKKGLKIGRSSINEIQSLQVSIAQEHAQIMYYENSFHLVDLGSQSGTYIKVHYTLQLKLGMLIQIGSYILRVQAFNQQTQIELKCIRLDRMEQPELIAIDFSQRSYFSFGRKSTNDFVREDQHMSGTHAKIYYVNGKFILEDMGSTNGTWHRLSDISIRSSPYKLQDGKIIKIGNTITYICQIDQNRQKKNKNISENPNYCLQCKYIERNMLFLPCRHTIFCEHCSHQTSSCPICNLPIEKKLRMFS